MQSLTSFLVNDRLAIDGGSFGIALKPEELGGVRHVIITHSHADHIASLPIYVGEAVTTLDDPVVIHGTPEVVAALREHIFNDKIWPDFEKITLPRADRPAIEFREMEPRKAIAIAGINVTPIPVNHLVPTVGLLVRDAEAAVLFTSDTYVTDEIWRVARAAEDLKAVFVDVSFPNELGELAAASKHLTPRLLASELDKLQRDVEVYAIHIKPTNRDEVIRQLAALNLPFVFVGEINRVYEWRDGKP